MKRLRRFLVCLLAAALLSFAGLEGYIFSQGVTRIQGEPQVMVILGCQVKPWGPSVLLQDRLDTALDYLTQHPEMPVVVSGGQGNDEHVSEAQCMFDYLTSHGVEENRIWREDRSRNTWQNLVNTAALLGEKGLDPSAGVVAVSNDFHLARVGLLYRRVTGGEELSTLAAPVSHAPSRTKMFFREPLALVKSFVFDR